MRSFAIISLSIICFLIATTLHAAELYGYIANHQGTPLGNIEIKIVRDMDSEEKTTRTNRDGFYSFDGITPGSYNVNIQSGTWSIYVGPGETRRDFKL